MKKILTLAAMLIGLSATAQIDSADIDSTTNHLADYWNIFKGSAGYKDTDDEEINFYVKHWFASKEHEESTTVTVNAARFYKFACNGTRGYIFHHDIPVYEFDIYGKLEVEIINQE